MFLAVQNEREFARLCAEVIGRPELPEDPRFAASSARNEHRAELNALIEAAFAQLTADQVAARLERADIANARLNTMQGFWDHPQIAARKRWRSIDSPAGPLDAMLPPLNIAGMEPRMDAVPALGQHSRAILAELGYDAAAIERLSADGAI